MRAWAVVENGKPLQELELPTPEPKGTEVLVVSPDAHRTVPLPSYPEIRIAYDPWKAVPRIRAFAPEAIHVATEGPLGFWTVAPEPAAPMCNIWTRAACLLWRPSSIPERISTTTTARRIPWTRWTLKIFGARLRSWP